MSVVNKLRLSLFVIYCVYPLDTFANMTLDKKMVFSAGHASLRHWLLPEAPPFPVDNEPTKLRVALGEKLFFDSRLSGDGIMSCATCHNPSLGWGDGLPTGHGSNNQRLDRATPTIINAAYNTIQMWDGRNKTLEQQALGPIVAKKEMNMDLDALTAFLKESSGYQKYFAQAYPNEPIAPQLVAKALASYQRTIISRSSDFDRWVQGDASAMSKQQINGFKLFVDPDKGNCSVCHSAPNFTDNGFHNLGLESCGF